MRAGIPVCRTPVPVVVTSQNCQCYCYATRAAIDPERNALTGVDFSFGMPWFGSAEPL